MINAIFLQSAGGTGMMNLVLFGGILLVFYFFIIRPQAQKQKQQASFSSSLEKGMEVATTSGIIGKINKIEDDFVYIQIDPKTFLKVFRSAVSKEMTDALNNEKKK